MARTKHRREREAMALCLFLSNKLYYGVTSSLQSVNSVQSRAPRKWYGERYVQAPDSTCDADVSLSEVVQVRTEWV